MRWAALGVDYEMYGKDHRPNAEIYSKICEILGGSRPYNSFMNYFSTLMVARFQNQRAIVLA